MRKIPHSRSMLPLFLIISNLLRFVNSYIISATLHTDVAWLYLDKFVFNPTSSSALGLLQYDITYNSLDNIVLSIYDDVGTAFSKANSPNTFCTDKNKLAITNIALSSTNPTPVQTQPGYLRSVGYVDFNFVRPRFVYVAISNCKDTCDLAVDSYCQSPLIDITYTLTMENGNADTTSLYHLSGDQTSLPGLYLFLVLAHICLLIFTYYVWFKVNEKGKVPHTVRFCFVSCLLTFVARLIMLIVYSKYTSSGYFLNDASNAASFIDMLGENTLLVTVMLIAKGWGIVRYKLPAQGRMKLGIYMTLYFSTNVGALILFYSIPLPTVSVSSLSNVGGYLLVTLRIMGFLWITYACFITWTNFHQHRKFYKLFFIIYGGYYLVLPIVFLIDMLVDEYVKIQLETWILCLYVLLAQIFLATMFLPRFNLLLKNSATNPAATTSTTSIPSTNANNTKSRELYSFTRPNEQSVPDTGINRYDLAKPEVGSPITPTREIISTKNDKDIAIMVTKLEDKLELLSKLTNDIKLFFVKETGTNEMKVEHIEEYNDEPFRDDSDLNTPTLGNSFYPAVEMGWGESKTNNPSEMRSNTRILVPPSLATSSSILAPPTGATTSALGEGRVSNAAAKWRVKNFNKE